MEYQILSRNEYTHLIKLIKEGSYDMCCKYVEENQLNPIHGVHALKCLIICVQYLKEQFSTEFLVKFITYLNIEENVKLGDMKNFLLSISHIVHFLIRKEELEYIGSILHQLKPFHKAAKKDEKEIYFNICLMCIKHYKAHQQHVTSNTFTEFMDWFISLHEAFKPDGLLASLWQLTSTLVKNNHNPQVGVAVIDALIRNKCHIFNKGNFKVLLNILENAFITKLVKSTRNSELISCIQKLNVYMRSYFKLKKSEPNGLYEVMDYFSATTKLYLTVDLLQLEDPDLLLDPISKINRAHGYPSALIYLEDVVAFSVHVQATIKFADRQLIDTLKPITFTKSLCKSMQAYISHAKSQGIILKRSALTQKCCCSMKTNVASAITSQIDAFGYVTRLLNRIKDESSINAEVYMVLHKLVLNCIDLLESLKEVGCTKVASSWDHLTRNVYNFCQKLAAAKRKNVNIVFLETLVKGCSRFAENSLIGNEKCTASIFYYLADCLVAFKRWDDAMDVCALSIRLHRSNRKSISTIWNTIMYNCKGQETFVDILERKSPYLQSIYSNSEQMREKERAELHKWEIQNYIARFKKLILIEKSLDSLAELTNTEEYISFLMSLPFDVIYYCGFKIFIDKHTIPNNNKLHSGIFKFLLYKHHLCVARENFKNLPKIDKMEFLRTEDEENENDQLHAPNYSHIAITVHNRFLTPLKEALDDLSCLRDDKGEEVSAMVLDLVIQIGHELELHCYESNARVAWALALQVAKRTKAFGKQVHVAAFTFKYLRDSKEKFVELMKTCQQLVEINELDIYTKFMFYTELATFYLNTDQLQAFRQAYHVAHAMFYELGGTLYVDDKRERNIERDLAIAHFALLIGAMEMLPCRDVVDEMHGSHTFQMPMNIWNLLLPRMQAASCPQQTLLFTAFFDLGEHIVRKYYWSQMAREAQQYAKVMICYAENEICTFRACRQLAWMGKLKMQALEVETCQEYIGDFDTILELDKIRNEVDKVDGLITQLEQGLLIRDTSPVVLKQFRAPEFLKHDNCTCTPCASREYQCALIEKHHLQCLVADHYKDHKTMVKLLEGCFSLYQQCKRKCEFYSAEIYAGLLWTSMKICRRLEDMDRFRTNMNTLSSLFEKYQYKNYYLYNEVNTLQLMFLVENIRKKTKIPSDDVEDNEKVEICKTPEYGSRSCIHPPRSARDPVSKESANTLDVPDPIGPQTRIRSKRNLITELQDAVQCEEQAATARPNTKTTISSNRKQTRSKTQNPNGLH